jgi:hypothetical protein
LEHINITNSSEEQSAQRVITGLVHILTKSSAPVLENVTWILSLVRASVNLRFGVKYSLKNAMADPLPLLNLALEHDELPLIHNFPRCWCPMGVSESLLKICQICLSLSQTESIASLIDEQLKRGLIMTSESIQDIFMVHLLPSPFEFNFNPDLIHVELTPLDFRVKCVCDGAPALVRKDVFYVIDSMVQAYGGTMEMVRWKCLSGDFRTVFALLDILTFGDFLIYMIGPVIGMNHWMTFLKAVTRVKPNEKLFAQFEDLLQARGAVCLLVDVENALGRREDAILALVDDSGSDSWKRTFMLSQQLEILCNREMAERRTGKRAVKVSDRVLNDVVVKAELMKSFSKDCPLAFDGRFDLLKSSQIADAMAFGALVMRRYPLALRLAELKQGSLDGIVEKFVKMLWIGDKCEPCIQEMSKLITGSEYELIASLFVIGVQKLMGNGKELAKFIVDNLKGNEFKVKLLLKFGFLREAKGI